MRLTSLHVEGLRAADGVDLPRSQLDPTRAVVDLPPGPQGVALLDAMQMVAATCHPQHTIPALMALGVAPSADAVERLDEELLPVQVHVQGGDAGALIDPDRSRTARIKASFELDPPLFGQLRQHAVRDPRLVNALSEATLSLTIGWMWTTDATTTSIGLLALAVGGTGFPATGSDRPAWIPDLLHVVGERIRRVPALSEVALAARLHEASLSPDPEIRRRLERVRLAMARAPFSLGALELVRLGEQIRPCFGDRLLRARQLGPAAVSALNLATTVLLDQPDILLAEAPAAHLDKDAVSEWLREQVDGEAPVLEQVLTAVGGSP